MLFKNLDASFKSLRLVDVITSCYFTRSANECISTCSPALFAQKQDCGDVRIVNTPRRIRYYDGPVEIDPEVFARMYRDTLHIAPMRITRKHRVRSLPAASKRTSLPAVSKRTSLPAASKRTSDRGLTRRKANWWKQNLNSPT